MSEKEKDKIQTKRADRMAGRGPHKMFKMEIKKYTDNKKGERKMKKRTTINCPFCRRKMKARKNDFPESTDHRILWDCVHCEALFLIQQMSFYPIKKEGEKT